MLSAVSKVNNVLNIARILIQFQKTQNRGTKLLPTLFIKNYSFLKSRSNDAKFSRYNTQQEKFGSFDHLV